MGGLRAEGVSEEESDAVGNAWDLPFNPCSDRIFPRKKTRERVLLLQGPVGPFFKKLQTYLESEGFDVLRVNLNSADRVFGGKKRWINFYGDAESWTAWFSDFIEGAKIDHIILFGAERPAHRIARAQSEKVGVHVVALEEGYIRPGYITVETGGNNASSPLSESSPPSELNDPSHQNLPAENFKGFRRMCVYGALYYALRTFSAFGKQKRLFHRQVSPGPELFFWIRNAVRRASGQSRNSATIRHLLKHYERNYYVIPLQVETDAQMGSAAKGWTTLKLISASLKSFAACAPITSHLVFKIHPLARGHSDHAILISKMADAFGVAGRVNVINTGSLGLLTQHAAGMITINSTSGLSAICHGIPLLTLGKTFYSDSNLTMSVESESCFDEFWSGTRVADSKTRLAYLNWVKHEALGVGDFYAPKGIQAACRSVCAKLRKTQGAGKIEFEAKNAG